MLSRYTMYRRRPANAGPLPVGIRQDTRYHTNHILRPTEDLVETYLNNPTDAAWHRFKSEYLALLEQRFHEERTRFDDLAKLAMESNVYLGCNCPTAKNPVHGHCHTYLALGFMKKHYLKLKIEIPSPPQEN